MGTPDLSWAGWTLTDEQFQAGLAVLAGILGVAVLGALARRASRVAVSLLISGFVAAAWWWGVRSGSLPDFLSR